MKTPVGLGRVIQDPNAQGKMEMRTFDNYVSIRARVRDDTVGVGADINISSMCPRGDPRMELPHEQLETGLMRGVRLVITAVMHPYRPRVPLRLTGPSPGEAIVRPGVSAASRCPPSCQACYFSPHVA